MHPLLDLAFDYLRSEVAPAANAIDADVDALKQALRGLCDLRVMALRRPEEYGGPGLSETEFRSFQEEVARASGSLAFLQTQHQSAVSMISKGENEALKARKLPHMADGELLMGIGFSQLRRPGPPILKATSVPAGYRLTGQMPWATGYRIYHEILVGAALEDGRAVFGVLPFKNAEGLEYGSVMRLAAMESPQTVGATMDGVVLREEDVCFIKPPGWIHENDLINITVKGFFAIGCARAGLDVMRRAVEKKPADFVDAAIQALSQEIDECRQAMVHAQDVSTEDVTTEEKLRVRAWAIDLAVRCAHAGVAASSGAANSVTHDAQRVYREALVYTVSAQTTPIMRATLERLVARGR